MLLVELFFGKLGLCGNWEKDCLLLVKMGSIDAWNGKIYFSLLLLLTLK